MHVKSKIKIILLFATLTACSASTEKADPLQSEIDNLSKKTFAQARVVFDDNPTLTTESSLDLNLKSFTRKTYSGRKQEDVILAVTSRDLRKKKRKAYFVFNNQLCNIYISIPDWSLNCPDDLSASGTMEFFQNGGVGRGKTSNGQAVFVHQYLCDDQDACKASYSGQLAKLR